MRDCPMHAPLNKGMWLLWCVLAASTARRQSSGDCTRADLRGRPRSAPGPLHGTRGTRCSAPCTCPRKSNTRNGRTAGSTCSRARSGRSSRRRARPRRTRRPGPAASHRPWLSPTSAGGEQTGGGNGFCGLESWRHRVRKSLGGKRGTNKKGSCNGTQYVD